MRYGEAFLELERRRLVRCKRSDNEIGYRIPADVIYALHDGREIEPKQIYDLSQDDFFSRLNELFSERKESEIRYDHLVIEMDELVNANHHLNVTLSLQSLSQDTPKREAGSQTGPFPWFLPPGR